MVDGILDALERLRARDAHPLAQGLGSANARLCLDAAIDAVTADGLESVMATPGLQPGRVTLVCAHGVFTSPIEWVALLVAAGCAVRIKAPTRDPALVLALADAFASVGTPVTASTGRDLGSPDAVIAFGDDESVQAVANATPGARHALYGHRFSVALVESDPSVAAPAIARDVSMYDSRGCMAPTAVFTTGDPERLAEALAEAMNAESLARPRGAVDGALGPEWRRRLGLGRILGSVREGDGWAVPVVPAAHFVPAALPRMAVVHAIADRAEMMAMLTPWRRWLSTLGTDRPEASAAGFHRVCTLGTMQTPPFPRSHDGRPMLDGVVEPFTGGPPHA